MRLPDKAESHYKEILGIRVSEIEKVCQPELRHAKEFMPRGGARGYAIADAILKRWRMLAEARMDCWLAAYRKFDVKLERADAVEFAREKFEGSRQGILNSFVAHAGGGIASNHFVNQFEQINRETRAKLLVAVTDLELERHEAKKRQKEEKKMRKKQGVRINVGRDAVGSVFQTGDKSKANPSVNIQLNQTLNQLKHLVEDLEKPDRDEALKRIDKLIVAATREPTPSRKEKVKRGFETVLRLGSATADLALKVVPLIQKAKEHWPWSIDS